MNKRKASSRRYAEIAVRDYLENKVTYNALRGEALHNSRVKPEVQIFSRGHDRDDTARRGALLMSIPYRRLEEDIHAVMYAIGMCAVHKEGDKIKRIITAVYWDKDNPRKKYQIAMELGIPQETAGRLANMFLDWVSLWYSFGLPTSICDESDI